MLISALGTKLVRFMKLKNTKNHVTLPLSSKVGKHLYFFKECRSLEFYKKRNPEQCPSVVSLLAESYNPHVRYGAAMALGIACAGTGLKVRERFSFSF